MNNCENCMASYAPYKTGEAEDAGSFWCELPNPDVPTKGVCQFCNPASVLFNPRP